MKFSAKLPLFALALLYPIVSQAQFKYFTTENGLQSNTVKCLFQSTDGQVWAGTDKGICRHDGVEFSEYGIGNGKEFRTEVFSICESDEEHRMWLGCADGLYSIDRTTMLIEKVDPYGGSSDDIESGIRCLCLDNRGNLWIGSNGKGIHRYNIESGICKGYPECSEGCIISRIMKTSDNVLFFCSLYDDCIYRYSPGRDEFVKIPVMDKFSKEKASRLVDICQDSYGDLWICDNNCTLFRLHPYDMQFVSYKSTQLGRISDVRVMIEHDRENLVIGTNVGLVKFNCNTMSFSWLDEGNVRNDGKLNDRFIYSLLRDKDNGLWVGTYFGGVNYKSPSSDIIRSVDIPDKSGKIISVMCETEKDNVLIGSDDGGLSQYHFNTGKYRKVNFDAENPNLNIHCIFQDGDDIWVGTYGNGLYRLHKDLKIAAHYDSTDITTGDLHVYSACRDSHGVLWIGTPQGICKYNQERDVFVRTLYFDKGNDVTDIVEWDGMVYFASQGKGLIRYNRPLNEFEFLTGGAGLPKRVSTLEVFKSELFLGSYEGLFSYDGNIFSRRGNRELSESNIASISADNNSLWITTTNGLFCYWTDDEIERYGRESGLPSETFNTNSSIKLSNGDILVGTERGLCSFKSADLKPSAETRRIKTVITDFSILPEAGGAKETRSCLEEIVIDKESASFSIKFSSLNYPTPRSSCYSYKLEGYDKDWNFLSPGQGHRDVTYTSVKPGKYKFEVCAAASENGQYGDVATLDILVRRPLYSWIENIAIVAFLIMIVAIILGIILDNRKVKHYLKSIRNYQIEKSLYESMLNDMIAETRSTLGRLRISLGAFPDSDEESPNGKIVSNNLDNLYSLLENDTLKMKAISDRKENSEIGQKADALWILENTLKTYKDLARNALNIRLKYSISDNARNSGIKADVNYLSSSLRTILDECLEKASTKINIEVDVSNGKLEMRLGRDGKKFGPFEDESIQTSESRHLQNLKFSFSGDEAMSDNVPVDPVNHRCFRKDMFNVIVVDAESGFSSGQVRASGTVFNFVVCSGRQEVEIGFSNFPITAIVCGQEYGTDMDQAYLSDLKKQHSRTLFLTLSSSVDDAGRIRDLDSFADLSLTRPVSLQLIAGQIQSLMKIRNTKTSDLASESSILKKIEQSDNFTKTVCEVVKANISKPELSVNDLAVAMNVCRATVFNRLKASLDTTPNNLIRDIRLEIAAEMLTQGNVRVSDVYYKIGFTSGSYFSKLFHERYGMSPKDYSR